VLANLSTGVLAFSATGTLRAANAGAMAILQDELQASRTSICASGRGTNAFATRC